MVSSKEAFHALFSAYTGEINECAAEVSVFNSTLAVGGTYASEEAARLCRGRVGTITRKDGAWIGFINVHHIAPANAAVILCSLGAEQSGFTYTRTIGSMNVSVYATIVSADNGSCLVLMGRIRGADWFRSFCDEHGISIPYLSPSELMSRVG